VTEQYGRAQALLRDHHAAHETLAKQLLKQETVSGSDVKEALAKNPGQKSAQDGAVKASSEAA
jgi:ATP-dependent Zn protease